MNRYPILTIIFSILCSIFFSFSSLQAQSSIPGDEALFSSTAQPNVLIILDNSNSMDEDFFGNGVGSWSTGSKAVEGKKVLTNLVNSYANNMRLGLMSYGLPSVTAGFIANAAYFASYDPRSYCPSPPDACVQYCQTGSSTSQGTCQAACVPQNSLFDATYIDDSISDFSYGSAGRNKYCGLAYPKTNRVPNPLDSANYIYFKQALPFYNDSQWTNSFWVAPTYIADDYYGDDSYCLYSTKTGTSDGIPTQDCGAGGTASTYGYSDYWKSTGIEPTDSDLALGYNEFGRRMASFNVGPTWRANSSPGGGYLHVPVGQNGSDNQQLNSLLNKLTTYENDPTDYMGTCQDTSNPNNCSYILSAGLTPTAGTLQSAISYFQGTYPSFSSPIQLQPDTAPCQQNFIIYVTDGLPSVDESGNPGTPDSMMGGVNGKIRTLSNKLPVDVQGTTYYYNIKTYIVGVGLTAEAKAQLDTMAVAGGTDVNGHAYYADSPGDLQDALNQIFSEIQSSTYSFSLSSVSSVRLQDENNLYVASFEPYNSDPFWKGHLGKIQIQDDGSLGGKIWDAGSVLENAAASSRIIKTYIGAALRDFNESIDPSYFGNGLTTDDVKLIVGYIRGDATLLSGGKTVPNPDFPRKLGDIFHSNPVTIATPSLFFNDPRDKNQAFDKFRKNHPRTSSDGTRIIVTGANDGQLHAFETGGGKEVWSFIPPNLLPKLNSIVHTSQQSNEKHNYFVDGPVSAAEVWLPISDNDGTAKNDSEWKTLLVSGLGIGVRGPGGSPDYLWSQSPYCDSQFQDTYNPPFQYYCGYYALDVTNTTQYPPLGWLLNPNDSDAPYLGEPWSKMVMGKVRIDGNEKWVGFIGGGYIMGTPQNDNRGKGFFVVDLKTGSILWSYTAANDNTMDYIPGSSAIVDRDSDGFIDTAYVGDLSGNLWKFNFCPFDALNTKPQCNTGDWSAMRVYSPGSNKLPIFNSPAVARDLGNYWIFWGTGDKANPNNNGPQNRFFALRDQNPPGTFTDANLQDISSATFTNSAGTNGWFINLNGQERVLSDATVYRGIVFFSTYTPPSGGNLCGATGSGALYGVAMMSVSIVGKVYDPGMGVFSNFGQRRIDLALGIPSAPVVSQKPIGGTGVGNSTPDVFVALSGGAGKPTEVESSSQIPALSAALAGSGPSTFIIHWKDLRVQPY